MQKKVSKRECSAPISILEVLICIKKNLKKSIVFFGVVFLCAIAIRVIQKNNYYKNNQDELNSISSTNIETIKQLEKNLIDYQQYKDTAYIMDINPKQVVGNVLIFQLIRNEENSKVDSMAPWIACKWLVEDALYEMVQERIDFFLSKDDFYRIFSIIFYDESQTIKIIVKSSNEESGTQVVDAFKMIFTNYCKERENVFGEFDIVLGDEYQYVFNDAELSEYHSTVNQRIRDVEVQLSVKESELTIAEKEAMTDSEVYKETLIDNWGIDVLVSSAIGVCFWMIYIVHLVEKGKKEELL